MLALSVGLTVVAALLSAFFFAQVREQDVLLDHFVLNATRGIPKTDTTALVLAISREVYRHTNHGVPAEELSSYERWESKSFFNMTAAVSLLHGAYGVIGHTAFGPCGTMTRTTLGALWSLGIPARKLQLVDDQLGVNGGHTMLEFQVNGRWSVLSPSDSSFIWLNPDGRIATVEEIQGDRATFSQILRHDPRYRYGFGHVARIRWSKLPIGVQHALYRLMGATWYEHATTPALYDQPRRLFWYASLAALVLCGSWSLFLWPRTQWRTGGPNPS